MLRATIAIAFVILFLLFVIFGYEVYKENFAPITPISTITPSAAAAEAHPSFLYGRITATDRAVYEGRLRWGRDQEAFWGDYFKGFKDENSWAAHVPPERLPKPEVIEIFGIKIAEGPEGQFLGRPFMARFGDIARIELLGSDVRVTLKSGTTFNLDWYSASDFGDGVRVWDAKQGAVDIGHAGLHTIDLFPSPRSGTVPHRLHGTVYTRQGDFTGFIQWNRKQGLGSDELHGITAGKDRSVRFDTIRSIAHRSSDSTTTVTLLDGREIVLSDTQGAGDDNFGIYVDDRRYGRVLISRDAFDRLDFSPADSSPTYDDFPPGRSLMGTVTTRDGRRLNGRLVYDLDESETTETLDAPHEGVDFMVFFGLIASVVFPDGEERVKVTLHNGETLLLDRAGDLDEANAGMLIFLSGSPRPEYVAPTDVQQIDFERPSSMYPPLSPR